MCKIKLFVTKLVLTLSNESCEGPTQKGIGSCRTDWLQEQVSDTEQ